MKKIIMLFLILSVLVTGCNSESKDNNLIENEKIEVVETTNVKVELAKKHLFQNTFEISGSTEAYKEVMITARVSSDVKSLNVDIGDIVQKDQIIANLNDKIYAINKNRAMLGIKASEIDMKDMKKQFEKYKILFKQNAISKTLDDNYEKAYELSKIKLELSKADYQTANENFEYTKIKSPIDGIVSNKKISIGENMNPGTPMFTIVDTSKVYVIAGVSEVNINKLDDEMNVKVKMDAFPDRVYLGKIDNIGPVPDDTNMYPVKILINNEDESIKVGMFATAKIELGDSIEGIGIPKNIIHNENGKNYIFIAEDNKAIKQEVVIGLNDSNYYEIIDGIEEGMYIIVSGYNMLQDKDLISIQE